MPSEDDRRRPLSVFVVWLSGGVSMLLVAYYVGLRLAWWSDPAPDALILITVAIPVLAAFIELADLAYRWLGP